MSFLNRADESGAAPGCVWAWDVSGGISGKSPTATVSRIATVVTTSSVYTYSSSFDDLWASGSPTSELGNGRSSSTGSISTIPGGHVTSTSKGSTSHSSTVSPSASTGSGSGGGGNSSSTGSGGFQVSAPHYVVYADQSNYGYPSASQAGKWNRVVLAFWLTQGAWDNAKVWESLSASARQSQIEAYHAKNIAIMVSAFGDTEQPTTSGEDPVQLADKLAAWVLQYGLDGVDVDYEDAPAMAEGKGEAWLIAFTKELRNKLPKPHIITHAPQAPWFMQNKQAYPGGGMIAVDKAVGGLIDFYNVQFYNQGAAYGDCTGLITNSGNSFPATSIMELNKAGIPLDKIVLGKPVSASEAGTGYMDPKTLAGCVTQGKAKGWNGGVMTWQWTADATNFGNTVCIL
ncbi:glycoside hydrolase superfamily [Naematelia encephala]|uniref:chitinase n=1 Tax=Naematelia encephala TaxID=71784 RepID=A0A1Y2AUV6_9TREE|nr:glycoside hydrolase superfamily [Naematelia encephala]